MPAGVYLLFFFFTLVMEPFLFVKKLLAADTALVDMMFVRFSLVEYQVVVA